MFMGGQGAKAGSIAYYESISPTLHATASGINQTPDVVYRIQGNVVDRDAKQNGAGVSEGTAYTVNTQDRHAVAYAAGFNDSLGERASGGMEYGEECAPTLRAGDVRAVVYDTTQITCPNNYSNPRPGDPCHPLAAQQHAPLAVYPEVTGALCANTHPGSYTGQDAFNDMLPVYQYERRYIVRRLTPLECCRLQGFPDWWEDGVTGSDSARYKMWGNGIALPCAVDVLCRITKEGIR